MLRSLSFLARRTRRYWQVLSVLTMGVVGATALLASSPTLVNTVVEFGMRHTLLHSDLLDANVRLVTSSEPSIEYYQVLDTQVQALLRARFGHVLARIIPAGHTRWVVPWVNDQPLSVQRLNMRFYDAEIATLFQYADSVGDLQLGQIQPQSDTVSCLVTEALAQSYGLNVGDVLPLGIRADSEQSELRLQVAGVMRPKNPQDMYWFGRFSPFYVQKSAHYEAQHGALVPRDAFFTIAASLFAPTEVDLSWNVLLDPNAIAIGDLIHLQVALDALKSDVRELDEHLRIETNLDVTLGEFVAKAEATRTPLYFLTATVVLLALYYVVMDAALALRQFQREFAILNSRGASAWQLFRVQLLEACLMCVVAMASGPGLALLLIRGLTVWGPLADIAQAQWTLQLPQSAWLAAVVGTAACLVGLLAPVPAALRRSIIDYQQSRARDDRPPWWQRLYLDVFVTLTGLTLIWRLRMYGNIGGADVAGPQVDWLILLSPLALLLGSATILLRVFPLLLDLGARLVSRGRNFPMTLALWQAAREPTHIARLVLLLTLAMALGLFSTGLNAALDRNEIDQSRYAVGSDLRIVEPPLGTAATLSTLPGVHSVSSVWRGQGTIAIKTANAYPAFDILAIEPRAFAAITHFRDDFADQPIAEMLNRLDIKAIPQPVLPLPDNASRIGLWLGVLEQASYEISRIRVEAKLQDANDRLFSTFLRRAPDQPRADQGLIYFDGDISRAQFANAAFPLSLYALWVREHPVRLDMRDLSVVDEGGTMTVLDSLTDVLARWKLCPGSSDSLYGLQLPRGTDTIALPALVSRTFQDVAQLELGDRVGTWINSKPTELEVVGVVDYFPTLYTEQDAGFVVTARDPLLIHLNNAGITTVHANELLVDTESSLSPLPVEDTVSGAAYVWNAEMVRKNIRADPLGLGLRSVTLFGYILTTVLSLAGFGTHFYLTTRQRNSMYAVLRALGLAPHQLYGMLLFEQVLLILSGLGLGTVLGLLLNQLTLPGLPLSLGGQPPVPPFLAQTDWAAVARIYVALAGAFVLSLGITTILLWRIKLHQTLRIDEE